MNEIVENNFINIYNKFDIQDKKLNNYHIKIDEINKMIDIIISNEYTKILIGWQAYRGDQIHRKNSPT